MMWATVVMTIATVVMAFKAVMLKCADSAQRFESWPAMFA